MNRASALYSILHFSICFEQVHLVRKKKLAYVQQLVGVESANHVIST